VCRLVWEDFNHVPKYPVFALTYSQVGYFWDKITVLSGKGIRKLKPYDCPLEYLNIAKTYAPDWRKVAKYLKSERWISHVVFIPGFCGHPLKYLPWMLEEQTKMNVGRRRAFDIVFTLWRGCQDRGIDNTWIPMALSTATIKSNDSKWDKVHLGNQSPIGFSHKRLAAQKTLLVME